MPTIIALFYPKNACLPGTDPGIEGGGAEVKYVHVRKFHPCGHAHFGVLRGIPKKKEFIVCVLCVCVLGGGGGGGGTVYCSIE